MIKLLKAHLFGDGLFEVSTPELANRYNQCLEEMGIERTKLDVFHIDGIGWSPEIAGEKKDECYLSNGIANQLAIIISPEQANKPIYFPFHSFDRTLMEKYFQANQKPICDITALPDSSIWLDFDEGMSRYERPEDLFLIESFTVRSNAGRLPETVQEQKTLVRSISADGYDWMDDGLRMRLIENAKQYGDLRKCKAQIRDYIFTDLDCFFIRAFGGTYVFRKTEGGPLLVILQQEEYEKYAGGAFAKVSAMDEKTIPALFEAGLIKVDLAWYRKNIKTLQDKLDYIMVDALSASEPNLDIAAMNSAQIKKKIMDLGDKVPDTYFELERLIRLVESRHKLVSGSTLRPEMQKILMRPVQNLPKAQREVIWHLLGRIYPFDLYRLYAIDKENFFTQYRSWPEAKKLWAIHNIKTRYNPRMLKSKRATLE